MVTYPADWEKVKLADLIIKGGSGGTPNTSKEEYYKGRIPFLSISDITNSNGYIYRTEKSISELGLNSSAAWIVPAEALTLAMYASVGKVAILKKDIATSQAFYNMIFSGLGTRDFVYYYLKKFDRDNLWNPLISTGTQANLNAKKIRNLEIYLPPLPEQQAIAATLSYFDEHIDNLTELIEKKKAIRDGALEDLVSGRTRLDGFNGEWVDIKVGDFLEFKNGLNKGKDFFGTGTPIVNYMDVYKNRGLVKKDIKGKVNLSLGEIKRFEVRKNDVFFTRTSETPEEVGISSVLLEDISNCVFSGFILRGRPMNKLISPEYCKFCFSTNDVRHDIIKNCTYTTRALTNGNQLSKIVLHVPFDIKEQEAIAEVLTSLDDEIESLKIEKEKMLQIKEGAMDDLLTGRVRLKA
ncbi:restriction endonuclease subunit S [Enterococcus faecalis]|nr:restriction endonuclease subunit S [Erysipelothrix rhusiopathiae]